MQPKQEHPLEFGLVDAESLIVDPREAERHLSSPEFPALVESVRRDDILQPPGVLRNLQVAFGTGRVLAKRKARPGERILVCWLQESMSEAQFNLLKWVENMRRQNWTPTEQSDRLFDLKQLHADLNQKQLSDLVGLTPTKISTLLAVFKCAPEVQKLYRENLLTPSDCAELAQLPVEVQRALASQRASGEILNREALKKLRIQHQTSETTTVKSSRVRMQIGGVQILVTGSSVSVEDLSELFKTGLNHCRRAEKMRWDIRTLERVLGDENRKEDPHSEI
ncbi:ParB/RepB/Spo0J family partition protein [Telmatocola sphagniphila]|uniref:ParB/RepB/Spo0J family partition protein n=1 Tax=Telmatocola sphagniphila TaxID=1123043 RepID=A0A8E6B3K4_9BACT|nr:ParB/RepB/Spo0J family partition protein [Telmatocola sphagniphila]QVL30809.1 ParB/RepB/Spo0J family partition protein [Telmatocola sphagniphila]